MAIIRCPACGRRISSMARACPHCHEAVGKLDREERYELARKRWRTQLYRARNVTYLAMGMVVVGALVWWMTPPQGLVPPVSTPAALLLGLGTVGYLCSWAWVLWLRYWRAPDRSD